MTPRQAQLIQDTFERVRESASPVALLFYGRLFALAPHSRRLFHHDLREQSKKLMDMLDTVTQAAGDLGKIRGVLEELGRKHAGYGVKDEDYEVLVAALLWALGQALEGDFDAEAREAWKSLLSAIGGIMKEAAAKATAPSN